MIDPKRLLADLKRLHVRLKDDLRHYHATSAARDATEAEWQEAFSTKRTAETFPTFFEAAVDQAAVHWILAAAFIRFLEDNGLIERPILSGPGERSELARERQQAWFRLRPHDSDAEYLIASFSVAAQFAGLSGLFDAAHNPLFRLPLSGDGAMALIDFFRQRVPETGALDHDFTDPEWNTRWLGDLYQDLSEEARKRYALLQTPDFVEAYILDRTLEPAIDEFGFEQMRMIDLACGSGHFLLGGFERLLREWQRHMPDMPPAAQAQRALDGVAGVDLNPFAAEIARFRLLLAALRASGETRLTAAPDFRIHVAAGDSLLHGRHFARHELGGATEGFRRLLRHHFASEDAVELDRILGRQYHAVVGNPPYITPKDPAIRDAYREICESCYMKYALAVPFIERFFDLAQTGARDRPAGFVGMIVADSFMKREFGKKLIEEVLPRVDLTHLIDCSGAYIPGHGTPTAILLGRNRGPVASVIRAVMGIRGEPAKPDDPAHGQVWLAIVAQTDQPGSTSSFVSVSDVPRLTLQRHPWSIRGGGANVLKEKIEADRQRLGSSIAAIGVFGMTNADEVMLADAGSFARAGCESSMIQRIVIGDSVRDWRIAETNRVLFPYADGQLIALEDMPKAGRWFWPARTTMGNRATFAQTTYFAEGRPWWEWHQVTMERLAGLTITFAFVATHNHFALSYGGKVFKQTAPIIKLPSQSTEDDCFRLLALLNCSTACFWLKSVLQNRGSTTDDRGARQRTAPFEDFYEFTGAGLKKFPLAHPAPVALARDLHLAGQHLGASLPGVIIGRGTPSRALLDDARKQTEMTRSRMVALQEELDWRCYRLYGLLVDAPEHQSPPGIRLGERAFEIVMARRMDVGELFETAWFEKHHSLPIKEIPAHWPADYRAVVQRRIELIESDPNIGLIERPEYKRRWSMRPWDEMQRDALRDWLLDRFENRRFWQADDPRLISTRQLADAARRDGEFVSVAELYAGPGFDIEKLVADLVSREAVPFLSALRYTETGLRKRAQWEKTWEKQRHEDAIDAEVSARRDGFLLTEATRLHSRQQGETPEAWSSRLAEVVTTPEIEARAYRAIEQEQHRRKAEEVGDIPVPPKYNKNDFLTADYWRLRGGLDVPKERFVSFPRCERDLDGSSVVTWAGYDHRARARAMGTYYLERKDTDGWEPTRLMPLLAGLAELVPWLRQWHNDYDPASGVRIGDYYAEFVRDEARSLGMTGTDLAAWAPPAAPRRSRGRRRPAPDAEPLDLALLDDLP
jgi:hypothetical protein